MKKSELTRLVMDGADVQFGERTAMLHINNVFNTVVGQLFNSNNNQFRFYTKRITLDVVNRVAQLTVPIIQTRTNGNGLPAIYPVGSNCPDDTEFYPMPAYALRSKADANHISGMVFYTVTGNEVRFNNSLPAGVTQVAADAVLEFQAYDADDFIALPEGVAQIIIDGAVAAIRGDRNQNPNIYKKQQ